MTCKYYVNIYRSRDRAQHIFNLVIRRGKVVSFMLQPLYLIKKRLSIHCMKPVSPGASLDIVAKRKLLLCQKFNVVIKTKTKLIQNLTALYFP